MTSSDQTIRFFSTRGHGDAFSVSQAIETGLAKDGGLFVPERLPRVDFDAGQAAAAPAEVATQLLQPFFVGDPLAHDLAAICAETFDFPLPVRPLLNTPGNPGLLELFHGPTAAFKDVGARFLAASMQRIRAAGETAGPLTILVATSGDTGGAVAAAFHRREAIEIKVLYPDGLVSPRQAQQLSCWGDNVATFRVQGAFDACQTLVKAAFRDPELRARRELSSANSINVGRLLPQMVYYAVTSLRHRAATGRQLSFVIPTGNLGNAVACVWARELGLPIERIVLATNANRSIPDFLSAGTWQPGASIATLASAMDVGDPSNMERLRCLFPDLDSIRDCVSAYSVSDEQISKQIAATYARSGDALCPHTATAMQVFLDLAETERDARDWCLVATAHAAKFETVVEPLIGSSIEMPTALADLMGRPAQSIPLAPTLDALRAWL